MGHMKQPVRLLVLFSLILGCAGGEGGLKEVPRNRTMILDCLTFAVCAGQIKDYDTFNPFIPGNTAPTGSNFLYEPLYFYNAFKEQDNVIPWIAESHVYNEDYTEVTVKIRPGVEWSDGMPWTVYDFVFTINMLKANAPALLFSTDMETWVKEAVALDDLTAKIQLTAPNPRFIFSYFTNNFGNGVPIVPKHIWEGKQAETFTNFDMAKGWPVVSGPYTMVVSTPEQRIWDVREDWWAPRVGFQDLPKVERIIYLPYMDESKRVQNMLTNHLDSCLDMRPPNIRAIIEGNPRVSTWTGREPPFGYLDWWPISLGFNVLEAPFDDVDIRWAINHAIDREQLVEVGWQGSGTSTLLPFPDYPSLRKYTDDIEDLLEKYPVGLYDPERSAGIMRDKGWEKNPEGIWARDGVPFKMVMDIYPIFNDLAPILVAQLERAGFDADFRQTSDTYTRLTQGTAKAYMQGHGGSVRDPYFTLRLYHGRFVKTTGTFAESFWRWQNAEFDTLVDEMGATPVGDPKLKVLFRQIMDIWLSELPSIPIVQWYHRIPHNEIHWTNWPTQQDPYINSAYWHKTWLLVLLGLEPAQDS
jgi:peptide/nickel transport system substrate-binding protein